MTEIDKNIADILMQSHCIDISKYDETFLNKSLQKRIIETCCGSVEEYYALLEQDEKEVKIFSDSLQISYSEFFRNPLTFAGLERIVLPTLLLKKKNARHKEIRIWSAACAAGQEAYSLAILLEELKNGDDKFSYRIFATDQCESMINKAQKGQYLSSSLSNLSMKREEAWFSKQDDVYTVKPELKENIEFSVFDLLGDQLACPPTSIFGDFDLLVCANLLFYYRPEFRKIIIEKIAACLAAGGYLVAGEAEREAIMNCNYYELFPQSAIFCSHEPKGAK
ncbi:MAG: protein-glutamate O-methyltransferase CheR [Nitrospirae bacterium]|nr:protein-glutamate O-methyltransferase CheR [Nitrospirota bacterium]